MRRFRIICASQKGTLPTPSNPERVGNMSNKMMITVKVFLVIVALVAAFNSVMHTVHVALAKGFDVVSAYSLPISVDGLMFVATMIVAHAVGKWIKFLSYTTLAIGLGGSFMLNMMAVADSDLAGHIMSGWFPVSLFLVIEMFRYTSKKTMAKTDTDAQAAALKQKRSDAAKKGAETRRRNANAKKRKPRAATTRTTAFVPTVEAADASAPVMN